MMRSEPVGLSLKPRWPKATIGSNVGLADSYGIWLVGFIGRWVSLGMTNK